MPNRVIRLSDYKWDGMLSIWGQNEQVYQAVCYAGLAHQPQDFIKVIAKNGPPIDKYFVRYVDLKCAQDFLEYTLKYLIPLEIQAHMQITRIWDKTRAAWPSAYLKRVNLAEIIQENNYEADNDQLVRNEADARGKYGGCTPWIKVSFDQELSAKTIFAVGVLLRYASEHGPVIKALEYMNQMELKLPREHHFTVAAMLGSAGGHAIGHWNYSTAKTYKKRVLKFSWQKAFLTLQNSNEPFWKNPVKIGDIDRTFSVPDSTKWEPDREEFYGSYQNNSPLTRNNITLHTKCNNAEKALATVEAE